MKLVNNTTGAVEDVPDEHAQQAFLSGKYGVQADQTIHAKRSDGSIGTVAPEHLQAFLQAGGQLATDTEARQSQLESKYGGVGGTLAAGAEGAARGLTLGGSDPLAVGAARLIGGDKVAEDVRQHLEEEKEAHPYVSTAGEVLGAAAPVLLSGGAAAPEEAGALAGAANGLRTLGAAPRAVGALGDAAEGAVSSLLGATSDHVIGKAAQSAAKAAVRATVEGGLFGAGQAVSDSELQDTPLTAEKLFHTVGHAALTAGALGGALGAAGSVATDAGSKLLGGFSPHLEDAAGEQTWKWLSPGKALAEKANKTAGGTDAVGKTVFEKVLRPLAEEKGMAGVALDDSEKLDLVSKAKDETGQKIGQLVDENGGVNVTLGDMLSPIDKRIDEWSGKIGGEDKVAALRKLRGSVMRVLGADESSEFTASELSKFTREGEAAEKENLGIAAKDDLPVDHPMRAIESPPSPDAMPIPIAKAMEQRRNLQRIAYEETKALDPQLRVQLLREVSGAWGDLEESALNKATADAPEGMAGDRLRALNREFQHLSIAEKALETNTSRWATNRNLSLTDYAMGAAHAPSALLSGNPLGAAASVGASFGHRWLREHGNAYAALMLDRLSAVGEASRAAQVANEATDSALSSMVEGRGRRVPRLFHVDTSRYEDERDRIQQMAGLSPALLAAHLQATTAPLDTHMPGVSQAMAKQTLLATQFLTSKLPPSTLNTPSLTPHLDAPMHGDAEKVKFLRYVDAVQGGPPEIFRRMAHGQLYPEDLETLQKVYPASLKEAQGKAMAMLADRTKATTYAQRQVLSALLGRPADATMTPAFALSTQRAYAAKPAPGGAGGQPKPRGGRGPKASPPTTLSYQKSSATAAEAAEAG